jgi:hypothetical protein
MHFVLLDWPEDGSCRTWHGFDSINLEWAGRRSDTAETFLNLVKEKLWLFKPLGRLHTNLVELQSDGSMETAPVESLPSTTIQDTPTDTPCSIPCQSPEQPEAMPSLDTEDAASDLDTLKV